MYAIAIDGPAGAGKSTIARRIASQLGWLYVDTGALYRAVGLSGLRRGVDTASREAILPLLPQIKVELCYRDGEQRVLLDGEDVSEAIRENPASMAASNVSAMQEVRDYLFDLQQQIDRQFVLLYGIQDCGLDLGKAQLPWELQNGQPGSGCRRQSRRRQADRTVFEGKGYCRGLCVHCALNQKQKTLRFNVVSQRGGEHKFVFLDKVIQRELLNRDGGDFNM